MKSVYYVTTPIYYVNADPHIGTAYTTILADVLARYHRLMGRETFFLTGTDEHGDKIARAAAAQGIEPQQFVDKISGRFRSLWPQLNTVPDRFIRTTDPDHVRLVQTILQRICESGDIYFGEYGGHYCTGCERFLTEKELVDGKCPDHQTVPEFVQEKNYFFRMSRYQPWLVDYIHAHPDFIRPDRYRNEVLGFLREPLDDLCISRPRSRLTWGIPIPFDDNFVTYVWFDALLNYLTAIGYDRSDSWIIHWESVEHLIAKDILKPHAIYWPIMLHAAGIEPYRHLTVHGYWNFRDSKISKSSGRPVDVTPLLRFFGADVLRYFLMRDMVIGLDATFSIEMLVNRINSDLANDLGNLLSRLSKLIHNNFNDRLPEPPAHPGALAHQAASLVAAIEGYLSERKLHVIIEETLQLIRATNRYFDAEAPWALAKTDKKRCGEVLYESAEALRIAAVLLYPVMPSKMAELLSRLGEPVEDFLLTETAVWGRLRAGARVESGDPLFPRIESDTVLAALPELSAGKVLPPSPPASPDPESLLSIEEFTRVQLRTAKIISAERIAETEKLLKLSVDIGDGRRQIVAGIAEHYSTESLVGKTIVVVANLKPTRLRGELSEGMLLAAKSGGKLVLLTTDEEIPPGATIR
ncbi:MAG: methionine--tRNA ligase [bacterium]|nr:methionine--tRNA ligase [bacterium]